MIGLLWAARGSWRPLLERLHDEWYAIWITLRRSSEHEIMIALGVILILVSIYNVSRTRGIDPAEPAPAAERGGPVRVELRTNRRGIRRGAATVELAAVLSLFVLPLVLGMIEASRLCMVSQLLTNAAREGCRVAVRNGTTSSDVTARVDQTVNDAGISSSLITTQLTPASIESIHWDDADNKITLTVSVRFNQVSWLPLTYFVGSTAQVVGSATMSSERP